MDKKSIAGIAALVIFLAFWQFVLIPLIPEDKMYQEKPKPRPVFVEKEMSEGQGLVLPSSDNLSQAIQEVKGQLPEPKEELISEVVVELRTDILHARFSSRGGQLTYLSFLDFHPEAGQLDELVLIDLPSLGYGKEVMVHSLTQVGEDQILSFKGQKSEVTYKFSPKSHFFEISVKMLNGNQNTSFLFSDVSDKLSGQNSNLGRSNHGAVYALASKSYGENSAIVDANVLKTAPFDVAIAAGDLNWAGWRSKYFAWLVQPIDTNRAGHQLSYYHDGDAGQLRVETNGVSFMEYKIYAGPINKEVLYNVNVDLYMPLFNYTGIDFIIHFLLGLLSFYNGIPGVNMGMAIIMLTITVKMCLFPLTLKSQTSMFMMSKLGPKIKELQEKYKNDRQMLGMKQMEMFKQNGVNPLAGCLPMVIQMPVFISLFSTIGEGFDLRQAAFVGWINDLSAPDRFSVFEVAIPFIGNGDGTTNLNLLPFLYIVTMFIQQSLMPKSTDPQQQQMQKMMKFMMMGFAVILYNYSSGLMLYFVGSNILGMSESWYIRNKVMPKLEAKLNT